MPTLQQLLITPFPIGFGHSLRYSRLGKSISELLLISRPLDKMLHK